MKFILLYTKHKDYLSAYRIVIFRFSLYNNPKALNISSIYKVTINKFKTKKRGGIKHPSNHIRSKSNSLIFYNLVLIFFLIQNLNQININ